MTVHNESFTTPVVAFTEEVISEAVGTSTKKWAIVLVAFVAGAILVTFLTRRRATRSEPDTEVPAPA